MKIINYRQRKSHKILFVVIGLLILVGLLIGIYFIFFINNKPKDSLLVESDKPNLVIKDNTIHLAMMGDMLAHDTIIANAKNGDSYDFAKYFANIRPSYQDADVIFCNQEGLSAGELYGISGYPSFNAPTKFAADLQSGAGCNLINLANNHMGDKGTNAIGATIDEWIRLKPLGFSGANKTTDDQNNISYAEVKGIKIGFVSFADFNNNTSTPDYSINNYHDEDLVRRLVSSARSNSDVVIVSMHWGVEDSNDISTEQVNEANLLSSLGADIVIGTGPHVLQKVQIIDRDDGGKTIVAYSLGNMLSSQLQIKELIGGIAQLDITKTVDNKLLINNPTFNPTYMHYEWTADQESNGDLLSRKNAMIYLLNDAADPLSKSLLNTTVDIQKRYVVDTLGTDIKVK